MGYTESSLKRGIQEYIIHKHRLRANRLWTKHKLTPAGTNEYTYCDTVICWYRHKGDIVAWEYHYFSDTPFWVFHYKSGDKVVYEIACTKLERAMIEDRLFGEHFPQAISWRFSREGVLWSIE